MDYKKKIKKKNDYNRRPTEEMSIIGEINNGRLVYLFIHL